VRVLLFHLTNHLNLVNIWLPAKKYCRLSFLQGIVTEEKKCLKADQVKLIQVDEHCPHYAVRNVWDLVRTNNEVRSYLPSSEMDEARFPDRRFFWGILGSIVPSFAAEYHRRVLEIKHGANKRLPEKKVITVSDSWLAQLT
jgi:hypothetical protein